MLRSSPNPHVNPFPRREYVRNDEAFHTTLDRYGAVEVKEGGYRDEERGTVRLQIRNHEPRA